MGRLAVLLALILVASSLDLPRRSVLAKAGSAQLTIVRGRVVAQDDAAAPMRGARVVLAGGPATADAVFTDLNGEFALGVPGSFTLQVTKAGYAPAEASGRASAGAADLQIRLARGATITGRVVDELGFPVVSARVRIRPLNETVDTDDNGDFRIGSLRAGRYSLQTETRRDPLPQNVIYLPSEADRERERRLELALPAKPLSEEVVTEVAPGAESFILIRHRPRAVSPVNAPIGGTVTGTVVDQFGEPLDRITVRLWQLRYAGGRQVAEPTVLVAAVDDRGQYRIFHIPPARYVVVATSGDGRYAPVYHPGVTTVANAPPVSVGRRQEVPGVHVTFARTRQSRLSGVVRGGGESFTSAEVLLIAQSAGGISLPPQRGAVDANGRFEFAAVAPGEYLLQARSIRSQQFGLVPVTINEGDTAPVTVVMRPVARIRGQVIVEDGSAIPSGVRVSALVQREYAPPGAAPAATIASDGTFEITGLVGPTRFALTTGLRGYRLKSVEIGGVNAVDDPVTFGNADDSRDNVSLVLARDVGTIAGRVTDDRGQEPDDYRVIAFSVNRERWFTNSPYVKITAGPVLNDGYVIQDLPPGEYWIGAVNLVDGDAVSGEWQAPEFLERLTRAASRVGIGERQRAAADLPLIRR